MYIDHESVNVWSFTMVFLVEDFNDVILIEGDLRAV